MNILMIIHDFDENQKKIVFQTEAALIRDSITLLSNPLTERKLFRRINEPTTRCDQMNYNNEEGLSQYWREGRDLMQNIDNVRNFHSNQ